jgi:hypothetical protein
VSRIVRWVALGVLVTLSACGSDGDGGGGGPVETACDLLTENEVAAAARASIGRIEETSGERCTWTLEREPPGAVTLVFYEENGRAVFEAGRPGSDSAQPGTKSVDGVGDGAYLFTREGIPTMTVLVGRRAFFVQYVSGGGGGPDPEGVVRELAALAADRL